MNTVTELDERRTIWSRSSWVDATWLIERTYSAHYVDTLVPRYPDSIRNDGRQFTSFSEGHVPTSER